jgi:hypothetical protein
MLPCHHCSLHSAIVDIAARQLRGIIMAGTWHMGWHAHQDLMHRSSHRMPRNARHRASFFLLKK